MSRKPKVTPDTSEVYYCLQDLLSAEGAESPYRLGRDLYKWVECGPWIVFNLPYALERDNFQRGSVYYESEAARGWGAAQWMRHCTGVTIGSIVEGSDAEVGPITLRFPFSHDQFWAAVHGVNAEACALWDEANAEEEFQV